MGGVGGQVWMWVGGVGGQVWMWVGGVGGQVWMWVGGVGGQVWMWVKYNNDTVFVITICSNSIEQVWWTYKIIILHVILHKIPTHLILW